MSHSLLLAFEENNHCLVARLRARLAAFCAEPPLHARFLNMLSLLEHIGSRKIMTSPAMRAPEIDILKHHAEEARHALFFKRAAERMVHRPLDYSEANTIAASAAKLYMGRLDAEILRALGKAVLPALPYLYMSLIVELRAVWTYRIYQLVLMEQKIGLTLRSILAEEELHLSTMLTRLRDMDPCAEDRIALFCGFEEKRFRRLWSDIEEECAVHRLAAQ